MERLLEHIPKEFHDTFTAIVKLTDDFCEKYLNEDYQQLARDMAIKICQKGSPVKQDRVQDWASGIIHALGWVNFLQDPDTKPYMSSADLAKGFAISQGTMTAKSKIIRDGLDIVPMDPDWCLPELLDRNPLVWMVEVNGFAMDVRMAPREIQEIAYTKGLIPYIPDDRKEPDSETCDEAKVIKFPGKQNNETSHTEPEPPADNEPTLF